MMDAPLTSGDHIMQALRDHGPSTVSEIMRNIDVPLTKVKLREMMLIMERYGFVRIAGYTEPINGVTSTIWEVA